MLNSIHFTWTSNSSLLHQQSFLICICSYSLNGSAYWIDAWHWLHHLTGRTCSEERSEHAHVHTHAKPRCYVYLNAKVLVHIGAQFVHVRHSRSDDIGPPWHRAGYKCWCHRWKMQISIPLLICLHIKHVGWLSIFTPMLFLPYPVDGVF